MKLVRGWIGALLVFVILALAGPSSAMSAGSYEFNDFRYQAYGPIKFNTLYGTQFETSNDRDWFKFKLGRRFQMTLVFQFVGSEKFCDAEVELFKGRRTLGFGELDGNPNSRPRKVMKKTLDKGTHYFVLRQDSSCPGGRFLFGVNK
ncbi:MAG: hypothetical protein KDB52_02310 [Solirubrobacterales bacterium]|nr:hypothetical protein [Solirubrobacterales bacterium]